MIIFFSILKTYWKQLITVLVISFLCVFLYNHVYNKGYSDATIVCEKRVSDYESKLNEQISTVEKLSKQLAVSTSTAERQRKKDFNNIIESIKNKPLYIVEQGTCKPSEEYINAYNAAVDRANKND